MNSIIGIDIGGTHTDIVHMHHGKLIASLKHLNTDAVEDDLCDVLTSLLSAHPRISKSVDAIHIGSTFALNALLKGHSLSQIGVIRLAGHEPITLPPGYLLPSHIRDHVVKDYATVQGGYECDGRVITHFQEEEIVCALRYFLSIGVTSIAVCGVFSSINPDQEIAVRRIIQEHTGNKLHVSLSHEVGSMGFMERENTTILNAALYELTKKHFAGLKKRFKEIGFHCPLFYTDNYGSLITDEVAINYPIRTLLSGPSNSLRGGIELTQMEEGIIVDIGGTSTDIGKVKNGQMTRSSAKTSIGNISLNMPHADILSLPIGGGSVLEMNDTSFKVTSESVGKNLLECSQSFGGKTLTLCDLAIAAGSIEIEGASKILPESVAVDGLQAILEMILSECRKVKGEEEHLPILLVGGGAALFRGLSSDVIILDQDEIMVANAIGAAMASPTYRIDRVIDQDDPDIIAILKKEAINHIQEQHQISSDKIRLLEKQQYSLSYSGGKQVRFTAIYGW